MQNDNSQPERSSVGLTLERAVKAVDELNLTGERADAVRLAVKALLVIRSGLHPSLFRGPMPSDRYNPYPPIAKHIRASNAETLGSLIDDVIHNISPNFVTLKSAGAIISQLFPNEERERATVSLLKEETIPIVMLMKALYQEALGYDEADLKLEAEEGDTK